MILEAAIVNLTRNLDILSQKNGQSISSHVKLKEEGLTCLLSLLERAPVSEYKKLIDSDNYDILLGYLINILCQYSKDDKSKAVRLQSMNIILSLVNRLESLHDIDDSGERCSISLIATALPGVSSNLFRLIMSDTKLPRNLLVVATKTLAKFISVAFLTCKHKVTNPNLIQLHGKNLIETCDNLAIRFNFLIDYVTNHSSDLPRELKHEILNFCEAIVCRTKIELLSRTLKSIVKYIAFISSTNGNSRDLTAEIQLRKMIIIDSIQDMIQKCDNDSDRLDSVVISCLFNLLDNLETHCFSMLAGERQSELSMLCGFLKILPPDSLTTFLEITEKRNQLIKILTQLTEFSTQQPFLFLTDAQIGDKALESYNERIYTVEKRFTHLTEKEISLIDSCCQTIGQNSDWFLINDVFKSELRQFSSPNNLFITHLILKGCLKRPIINSNISRFTMQMVEFYIDQAHEEYIAFNESLKHGELVYSQDILKIVIAIETLVTLIDLHIKFNQSESEKIIILRTLLCPLLNWASSNSRAISEAALSALNQISLLYGNGSTKSLIEANIDYIVDGVMHMLENFAQNSQVIDVLAITLKLSSIDSFYYFRDVYEKVFKLLGAYHHTEKSKSIALLFYRTVFILSEWKEAKADGDTNSCNEIPLKSESSIRSIIYDLDIGRRLEKLHGDMLETDRIRNCLHKIEVTEEDQNQIMEDIESGNLVTTEPNQEECHNGETENKKQNSADIVLTEKILNLCVNLISSNYSETKILALKTAAHGLKVLCDNEDILLPLVHQLWSPLVQRLTGDYKQNLEINLCAFECLVSMAVCAKDFIKRRTLDSIIPRLCLFLESQASLSKGKKDYGPYCMTIAYKCQLRILSHLGALAYHIQLAYSSLWRVVRTTLIYLEADQVESLREASRISLHYMIALDADCVWFFAKKNNQLDHLPFKTIYETIK